MSILLLIILLAVCLVAIIKSADFLIESSAKLGLRLGISSFVIGATLVALGSSLPELAIAISSALQNKSEFGASIVIGSNIATIALVMGICVLWFGRIPTRLHHSKHDHTSFLLCTALLILVSIDTTISRAESIILGFFFVLYIGFRLSELSRTHTNSVKADISLGNIVSIVFWLSILATSSYYVISLVTQLALKMSHVNPDGSANLSLIALTIISMATAIPETVAGFFALRRQHYDLFYGNLFGSLTFNSLLVPAISGLILPLKVTQQVFLIGFPTFILLGGLFYLFVRDKEEITRFEALGLFVAYALFVLYVLNINF